MPSKREPKLKTCAVVPAYSEAQRITPVITALLRQVDQVVVVDDGSKDRTSEVSEAAGAVVLRHDRNRGKGEALKTGFAYARAQGFDVVITMDADGQHDPCEIPKFIEAYQRTKIPVLLGNRMTHLDEFPLVRRHTNRFMSWLISRIMNQYIPDTQCGYRLYRCDVLPFLNSESHRFAAETEMLLHLADRGFRIDSVRIATIYGNETSKIRPLRDAFRFFNMLVHYLRERRGRGA